MQAQTVLMFLAIQGGLLLRLLRREQLQVVFFSHHKLNIMAERQVRVLENQDKQTDRQHLKVSISEMKPVVNIVTVADIRAKIQTQEKEVENLQSEILRCNNEISRLNEILFEIEKAIV